MGRDMCKKRKKKKKGRVLLCGGLFLLVLCLCGENFLMCGDNLIIGGKNFIKGKENFLTIRSKSTVSAAEKEPISVSQEEKEREDKTLEEELEELKQSLSLESIDEALGNTSLQQEYQFSDVFESVLEGNLKEGAGKVWKILEDYLLGEVKANQRNFVQIILVAILSALFSNIASGFLSSTLQETGFFVVYLTMTGIILHSFSLMLSITEQTLQDVFSFVEVLLPAYAMSVTMVSGGASAIALYEITFLIMKGCQWALKTLLVPLIECYMVVGIINYVGETERFTYLGKLVKNGTEQLLKWSLGVVLGINLIQNMILPAVDSVKSGIWQKGLSAIPGAGAVIQAVTGSLLGSAVLIKNSIGVVGLLFLILICGIPLVKLVILMISFYFCAAFLQPISDKRLMKLLHTAGESGKLFVQVIITCFALFFITIALAAVSTNVRYYTV